ncbi:MAG: hypothetical protein RLZZ216_1461, partial [Cyanobacteriota bacterium]
RAWGYAQQDRGLVVIIDMQPVGEEFATLEFGSIVAADGLWVQQLLNWTTDESGGGGIGGQGDLRVAAGGFYGLFIPPVQVNFPAAGAWVELNSSVLQLQPYAAAGSSNVTYDVVNNRLRLDWGAPIPQVSSWMQGMAALTVAASSNNQTYAIAFGVNGTVETDTQVRFIRENPNDSETVTLHGHRQVPNLTELSLFISNQTSTAPVAISNVNFRFFGNNNA